MCWRIILLTVLSFIIFGCSNKEREAELLNRISKLETQLDECQNGAEKIYARIKFAFEKEDLETCKSLYKEMEKRHPDSELLNEATKIYQKVINIENKREEERKLIEENAKKEKLKSLNKLKKEYDDVSGITWYKQPYFTHYVNKYLTSIYLGKENNNVWLGLMMSYEGDDWIFFTNAFLSYESNTKEIYFDEYRDKKSDSGYGGRVWEWIDVTITADIESFLREFAKSKDAKMRFSGKYTKTRNLSPNERQGILDVLNGYDALKESLN